ncbi:ABC transporter substrate-binding protein [Dechloromonas denitrificans]|uniref:ABC transporter substrate-binding protein n=1 Tax=Dechloromonas denitrificans TaxID=281362 RepID=UPI001CFABB98|nr:ABC transporter substrate-binding protein [Dechloromonas denitrificans]UCV09039.1 ABC transporter substrate-binding protein [Dechloromonas denitrificans]
MALPLLPAVAGCKPTPPLAVASHVWPGYELMFLARSEGWLPGEALRLLETRSATDSIAALMEHRAEAAALTLDEVLRVRAGGIPLTVVLVFDISAGADVVIAKPEIRRLADLKGKVIGAETSALGALILVRLLAKAGLTKDDVSILSLTPDSHFDAWHDRRIDALITYEPTASRLLSEGAKRLLDSRQFPETIFDVLAVRSDLAHQHEAALRALIGGHFRGIQRLRQSPQDTAYRLAGRLALPGDRALQTFRGLQLPSLSENKSLLVPTGRLLAASRELNTLMLANGLLAKADNLLDLVSDAYLPDQESA